MREEIIFVKNTWEADNGYLRFITLEGQEWPINPKRKELFPLFLENQSNNVAIRIKIDEFNKKEYIAGASLVGENVKFDEAELVKGKVAIEPEKPKLSKRSEEIRESMAIKAENIEISVWYKELGEWLRLRKSLGLDVENEPIWSTLYRVYMAKMMDVLGIKIEKK